MDAGALWLNHDPGSKTVIPIQKKVKAREERWITLLISREDGEKLLKKMQGTRYKARIRLLEALLKEGKLETSRALKELGTTASVLKYFQEQQIAAVECGQIYRNAIREKEQIPRTFAPILSEPQRQAVAKIRKNGVGSLQGLYFFMESQEAERHRFIWN